MFGNDPENDPLGAHANARHLTDPAGRSIHRATMEEGIDEVDGEKPGRDRALRG